MQTRLRGNAMIYVAMMLATIAVTIVVSMVVFTVEQRTPSFFLSLAMLALAEGLLFSFPIYHSRTGSDVRAPGFAFGFGFQAALVIYVLGVIVLCLISGAGTVVYSLTERFVFGEGMKLVGARATGATADAVAFDGLGRSVLAGSRSLEAGAQDVFLVTASVRAEGNIASKAGDCELESSESGTGFLNSVLISTGRENASVRDCAPLRSDLPRYKGHDDRAAVSALDVRLTVKNTPVPVAGQAGMYDVAYQIEVSNRNWFVSFKTLAIFHAVWFLLLFLTAGFWRIGSKFVTSMSQTSTEQRAGFRTFRNRLSVFADNAALERSESLRSFSKAVQAFKEEAAYASSETLPGTESYDSDLVDALESLQLDYENVRNQATGATVPEAEVARLVNKVSAMTALLRRRDETVKAAR